MRTTPNPAFARFVLIGTLCVSIASCGGNGDGGGGSPVVPGEQEAIQGKVIDGYIDGALVCIDLNANGRCDGSDPRTTTDSGGVYALNVPKGSTAPLVAEVIAGQSRDSDQPGVPVDISYRMASPSPAYSTSITPFSTLVHASGERNLSLAEDLVRAELGLPPRFTITMTAPADAGSLTQAVAKSIVTALKTTAGTLDLSAANALKTIVAAFPPALNELPQLRITTKGNAPIVSKEIYVDATFSLTNPAASVQTYDLNGKIRGRGQSTWGQPKNPYKIQFTSDASYAKVPDFLGMKKNRNWALLADYFDRSLIRNKLALSLGSSSAFNDGLKWTSSGQHVEVVLNGDYVGVYLLTEDIRIASSRLNIKEMSDDPAVNDLDGGYIVEVDVRLDCYRGPDLDLQLITPQQVPFCIDTPDEEAITVNQLAYIKDLLRQVEQDLYGPNRIEKINPASFVDWYLIQELFRNNDAIFVSSDFMWKDTQAATNPLDRLLNMGPLWDFDRAAGNVNYFNNWETAGCWVSKPYQPNWISKLFDNPDFLALTISRWKQKRPAIATFLNASIDAYARRLEPAQQRNFARWPIFGVPLTNYYVFANHAEEVAFVKRFLNERMAWLDKAYASPEAFNALCK
jgi:hypothetical protein